MSTEILKWHRETLTLSGGLPPETFYVADWEYDSHMLDWDRLVIWKFSGWNIGTRMAGPDVRISEVLGMDYPTLRDAKLAAEAVALAGDKSVPEQHVTEVDTRRVGLIQGRPRHESRWYCGCGAGGDGDDARDAKAQADEHRREALTKTIEESRHQPSEEAWLAGVAKAIEDFDGIRER